ncbi:site-specific DNA-methyltransferase [Alloscardovia macacae]|uniref:DNA methyltransferase n=1 Tax=Alloscardovia macacae TaxID=1160091 RepID=A0A261F401_9BIFI|nr:site-specific DNA-methyltransferase [Alloscardovia macacae]OZG53857.1 DNA methyltransferase [Alloscardovia macacae]
MEETIHQVEATTPNYHTQAAHDLARLFPQAMSDGKIDLNVIKTLLGEDTAPERERFGLFWPGKADAIHAAQIPTTATLSPDLDHSVHWDTTENIFIEGDNLEVLKILQKHYYGKIKCIYIDPPYNTGKDFVYPDNYSDSITNYLDITGQRDSEGKITTNSESDGRFHSKWLNMMYPRLVLARNLLTRDGVIFISIDDNEAAALRALLDEIFGSHNFLGQFVWTTKNAARGVPPRTMLMSNQEYVLAFGRDINQVTFKGLNRDESDFGNPDNDPRGLWRSESLKATGKQNNYFSIVDPETGNKFYANWAFSEESLNQMIKKNLIIFPDDETHTPRQKKFIDSYINDRKAFVTNLGWFSTENATKTLMSMFSNRKIFDFPKPLDLIAFLINQATQENSLILDFFAGSGTTAHAVMQLNAEDGGHRRCISVQLPEPTPENSEAHKAGFQTIADISRERIRRAGTKILEERENSSSQSDHALDTGFRAYKLTDTHFAKWQATTDLTTEELQGALNFALNSADSHSSQYDLLTEILLKMGVSLTEQISQETISGLDVYSIAEGTMYAYLDAAHAPTLDQIRHLIKTCMPGRLILLEDCFTDGSGHADDELKTNIVQECKAHDIELYIA